MALSSLAGKLRVLPVRAAASRAFASQTGKKKCKAALMMEKESPHDVEGLERLRKRSVMFRTLGVVGSVGFVALVASVVHEVLADITAKK